MDVCLWHTKRCPPRRCAASVLYSLALLLPVPCSNLLMLNRLMHLPTEASGWSRRAQK